MGNHHEPQKSERNWNPKRTNMNRSSKTKNKLLQRQKQKKQKPNDRKSHKQEEAAPTL
jgi:hypothetical protein